TPFSYYRFFPALRRVLRAVFFDRFFPADFRAAFRLAVLRTFFLARFGADDLRDPPEDLRARAPPLDRRPPPGPPISGSVPPPASGVADPPVNSSSGIPIPLSKSSVMM